MTWVGHSTLLVRFDGVSLLTDPIWSERASPVSFAGPRRVVPPAVRFEDLPLIDLVLSGTTTTTTWTLRRSRGCGQRIDLAFSRPSGSSRGSRRWIAAADELDWSESRTEKGVTVVCTPVQHWSARSLHDENRRLWASWAVLGRDRRFYFAGDTGYFAPIFQ